MIALETAEALFKRALGEEIGISVRVDDPKAFRDELLQARTELANPEYEALTTALPAGNKLVFICRKDAEAP